MALCRYLELDVGEQAACPKNEDYNYNVLLAGLGLFGFEPDDMQLTSSTANLTDATTVLGFLVHKTNPGHWYVLKRKGDNMYSLIDSIGKRYDNPKPLNQITLQKNTDTIFRIIKTTGKTIDYKKRIGEGRNISEDVCTITIDNWYASLEDKDFGEPDPTTGKIDTNVIKTKVLNEFFRANPDIPLDKVRACISDKSGTTKFVPKGYTKPQPQRRRSFGEIKTSEFVSNPRRIQEVLASPAKPAAQQTYLNTEDTTVKTTENPLLQRQRQQGVPQPVPAIGERAPEPYEVERARAFLTQGINPAPFKKLNDDTEYGAFIRNPGYTGTLRQQIINNWQIVNYGRIADAAERLTKRRGGMRKNTFRRRRGVTTKKQHVRRTSYRKNRANRPHSYTRRRS
jgi:hypothetical protein